MIKLRAVLFKHAVSIYFIQNCRNYDINSDHKVIECSHKTLETNNFIRSDTAWTYTFSVDIFIRSFFLFCYSRRYKVWEERRIRRLCTVDQTPIYCTEHADRSAIPSQLSIHIQWIQCNRERTRTSYGDIGAISSIF